MTETLFASLRDMCDKQSLEDIAGALGESEQSVSHGLQSSIASVLGSIAGKAGDPVALRNILDLFPGSTDSKDWSNCSAAAADPNSPLVSVGKRILTTLFGPSEGTVTGAISAEAGLRPRAVSTLLALAAPMVLGNLNRMVREEGMTMSNLSDLLHRESGAIRNALPAGVSDLFWPAAAETSTAASRSGAPRAVKRAGGIPTWVPASGLVILALAAFWLLTPVRKPSIQIGSSPRGTANRMLDELSGLGKFVKTRLPNRVELNVPERGTESALLSFVRDPNATVNGRSVDFDRVAFEPGSANIQPESGEQLDNIAAILTAYPNVKLRIAGYTDGSGSASKNMTLSQERAESVKAWLVAKGVAPDRLQAQGFGEMGTMPSNADSRRASLQVIQK